MFSDRLRNTRFQSIFYRDNFYKMLNALIAMTIIMLLLIAAIIYVILFAPAPQYYATTTQGKIIPMTVKQ